LNYFYIHISQFGNLLALRHSDNGVLEAPAGSARNGIGIDWCDEQAWKPGEPCSDWMGNGKGAKPDLIAYLVWNEWATPKRWLSGGNDEPAKLKLTPWI
jgi:hypothetical protein